MVGKALEEYSAEVVFLISCKININEEMKRFEKELQGI